MGPDIDPSQDKPLRAGLFIEGKDVPKELHYIIHIIKTILALLQKVEIIKPLPPLPVTIDSSRLHRIGLTVDLPSSPEKIREISISVAYACLAVLGGAFVVGAVIGAAGGYFLGK